MKKKYLVCVSLGVLLCLSSMAIPTRAMSASVVLYPSADTFISSENQSTNYGTNETLQLGYNTSDGTDLRHILLKFDLSDIPSNATITDARVRLYNTNCLGTITPNEVTMRKKWNSWSESEMTYASGFSNVLITTRTGACSTYWGFIVTDTVQAWVEGEENNGFILMGISSTPYTRSFYSKEHGTNIPELDVAYTLPESTTSTTSSTSTSASTATTSIAASTSTASSSSSASQTTSTSSEQTTDSEVQVPELTGVLKNGLSLLGTWNGVELNSDDVFALRGQADPGATITVSIGDYESTAVADDDGNWIIEIFAQDLPVGEHLVIAQASLNGSVSSEEPMVMVYVLGAGEGSSGIGSTLTSSIGTMLIILAVIFMIVAAVGVIVLVIVLKKKKTVVAVKGDGGDKVLEMKADTKNESVTEVGVKSEVDNT